MRLADASLSPQLPLNERLAEALVAAGQALIEAGAILFAHSRALVTPAAAEFWAIRPNTSR